MKIHFLDSNQTFMVNRFDVLTYELLDYNKLKNNSYKHIACTNSFLIKYENSRCKGSLLVFMSYYPVGNKTLVRKANFFTSKFEFDDFIQVFLSCPIKFGIRILTSRIVTTVWTNCLLSEIGELSLFFNFCKSHLPNYCIIEYEPELFPCIQIKIPKTNCKTSCKFVTCRISYTGKVNLLGAQNVNDIIEPIQLLDSLCFDYCLNNDFDLL